MVVPLTLGHVPKTFRSVPFAAYLARKRTETSFENVAARIIEAFEAHRDALNSQDRQAIEDLELLFGQDAVRELIVAGLRRLIALSGPEPTFELDPDTELVFRGEALLTIIAIVTTVISIVVTIVAIVVTIVYAPENCGDVDPATVPPPEGDDRECAWIEKEEEEDIEIDMDVEVECTEVIDMVTGELVEFICDDPSEFDYDFSGYDPDFEYVID